MSNMPPSYPQAPPQQPMPPAPKRPQLTPEERRRKLMRSLWLLLAGSMLTLSGTPFLLSPFPLFLLLFVLVFLGIGLTIMAIVRNAQGRGPWIFYVAAGLSLLFAGWTLLSGLVMALNPDAQNYRQCYSHALTDTDMKQCQESFDRTVRANTSVSIGEPAP